MIKYYCDRCGKEIESQVYYITITSDSLTSLTGHDKRQTVESDSCNIVAHLSIPRIYCKECRNEIEKFINMGGQQPPKGETIYCKDCENLMFSDCYGECAKGHKGIVNPNDTCKYATRRLKKGE